jgi:NADPH-dependent 2,4-dienoyl-CoA reductase/sulfur reductase-like enzyme
MLRGITPPIQKGETPLPGKVHGKRQKGIDILGSSQLFCQGLYCNSIRLPERGIIIANIRCSNIPIVSGAIAEMSQSVKGSVLVVGGGIAGMQSALDLADSGYYVYLLEQSPAIGGVMAQLDKTFPTNDCAM